MSTWTPKFVHLELVQYAAFSRTWSFPVAISAASAEIRDSAGNLIETFTASIDAETSKLVTLSLTQAQTGSIVPTDDTPYIWDLLVTHDSLPDKPIRGSVVVHKGATVVSA